MVFYMSWLVTWFDLLSSSYPWHPSHYFIIEKSGEIIFITLVASMIAYGSFEGTIKRMQYARRAERLKLDQVQTSATDNKQQQQRQRVKAFESFFRPPPHRQSEQAGKQRNNLIVDATGKEASSKSWAAGFNLNQQQQQLCLSGTPTTASDNWLKAPTSRAHLTAADQCKLNAELRANNSFASIGLYESAGATGDLAQLASDPRASPAPSQR